MLSQLFPNLALQQPPPGRTPPGPFPGPRSSGYPTGEPELTSASEPQHHIPSSSSSSHPHSLPIPTLHRPVSAGGATIPPPPIPPLRSASISSPGVVRPGSRLVGHTPVYDPKLDPDTRSLEVTPITLYVSERASDIGSLISVNEHYISYPIRNGLIRVINQSSVNRILLRKHEQHAVTELAFFNATTDLLLSAGTDNHIVVWRLAEDMYASKPMSREIVRTLPVRAQRVKWHPVDSTKIAIAQDASVFVIDLTTPNGADDPFDLRGSSVGCNQSKSVIHDVVFTPDGQHVVTAGADGLVHVYQVGSFGRGEEADYVRGFNPLNSAPLNSLNFLPHAAQLSLVIGGQGNTVLSMWSSPVDEPQALQTVRINSTHAHEVVVDATHEFIYVADRSLAALLVFHIRPPQPRGGSATLDHVTEFSLAFPILSMTVMNKPHDDAMQLYCIQTQAIQRYHVPSTTVYIAPPPTLAPSTQQPPARPLHHPQSPSNHPAASSSSGSSHPLPSQYDTLGQSVGALTAEDDDTKYEQSAAESPRALVNLPPSPETELDISITVNDFNGSDEGLSSMLATDGGGGSVGGRSTSSTNGDNEDHRDMDAMITQTQLHRHGNNPAGNSSPRSVSSLPMPPPIPTAEHASSPTSVSNHEGFLDDSGLGDSGNGSAAILAQLRRLELQQRGHHDQMKDQYAAFAAQVSVQLDKTVRKHLQGVVVPAIGRIVLHTMENSVLKPIQKAVEDALAANGAPASTHSQDVRDAFRDTFQSHIIPSFQAATQRMFEQIQDTFVKGTRAKIIESNGNLTEFQTQLEQLTHTLGQVSQQLATLPALVGANGATDGAASLADEPDNATHVFEQQCHAIQALLDNHQYEEGFQLALGAENVALVRHACQHVEPTAVLGKRPSSLSQMIVLCLVQQLGSDVLNLEHLALHLQWLRESLLVMNPKDPAIAPFVQSVMHELKATLGQIPDDARDSQYTLVHHILNSMLSFA
ncbi:hypothetical protein DYB32_008952 [Aphanomyces invadans]|uniref:Enhancer of mRNA-decapping protein 4 WD40 repeat region domain-containing protein n=1 Tax=Aphanomyces invadans TaxID=157072 RepID=A0A418AJZ2_9STRA|nr:hypothetical protein DYB32_008952 [Aphanomyces invadans]